VLDASTRGLQWIVDAYNLAFAALVLGSPVSLPASLFLAPAVSAARCDTRQPQGG